MTRVATAVLLLSLLLSGASQASVNQQPNACGIGKLLSEHAILRPQPGTDYSVDALGPDVVRVGSRYYLYFGGNDQHIASGHWRTGLAVSRSPLGPFKVVPGVRLPFVNGGTVYENGRFIQPATDMVQDPWRPAIYTSENGEHYTREAWWPDHLDPGWRKWQSAFYTAPTRAGFNVYFSGESGVFAGSDIGVARYRHGRWTSFKRIFGRGEPGVWDAYSVGEPSVFEARGRKYMLYTAMAAANADRFTGLAYSTPTGWKRCGRFIGPTSEFPDEAIDAVPQVVGDKLYVYFGRGQRLGWVADMNGTIFARVYKLG